MRRVTTVFLFALCAAAFPAIGGEPVFREPFTLRLSVDSSRYYEENFKPIPFVADGVVYLFKGDEFGINVQSKDGSNTIVYVVDPVKADLGLKFTQEIRSNAAPTMLLVLQNHSKKTILLEALMTVPGHSGAIKTSMVPIRAGLSSYESWPHPIVQLALQNITFGE